MPPSHPYTSASEHLDALRSVVSAIRAAAVRIGDEEARAAMDEADAHLTDLEGDVCGTLRRWLETTPRVPDRRAA